MPQLKIDAQHAAQSAREHQALMNGSRFIPPQLEMIREISEKNKVFIFNVGPWKQERLMGSLGAYIIPPCPEGREYSDPVIIPGIVEELYPINEGEFKRTQDDGYRLALQIVGLGPHLDPRNSFVPYGVFVSKTNPPSKEDVRAARAALSEKYRELVAEADLAYSQGPKAVEDTIRPQTHFLAARALRKTEAECPWMKNSAAPAERAECPGCGAVHKVGVLKCRECGYVLDKAAFDKAVKEGRFAA